MDEWIIQVFYGCIYILKIYFDKGFLTPNKEDHDSIEATVYMGVFDSSHFQRHYLWKTTVGDSYNASRVLHFLINSIFSMWNSV